MIQLARHIEILLLDNDCVIVPDFGGFMAHHVEARYDETDGTFLPPSRTIGFNPSLKMNDYLLVQSYIEAYDISYPEALDRVEDETQELRRILEQDGRYELPDIGILSYNQDGQLEFTPCEAGLLTPSLYGLSNFAITPLKQLRERTVPVIKTQVVPGTAEEDSKEQADGKVIKIHLSWLRNAAVACIILAACVLLAVPMGSNESSFLQGHIDTGLFSRLIPKDATVPSVTARRVRPAVRKVSRQAQKQTVKSVAAQKQKVSAQKETASAIPAAVQEPRDSFTIVMASHVGKANARAFVRSLGSKGFVDGSVLAVPGKHTKVIYGRFDTEKAARQALHALHNRCSDFTEECWIMKL